MFDWTELFYFELIVMRTSGFVLGSPFMGRSNVPNYVKAGIILVFSSFLFLIGDPSMVQPPSMLLELVFKLLVELLIGLILGFVLQLCMMTVQFAGEIIDTQMGLTMSQIYDASSQINMTVTGSLLNLLFVLNFFLENGHYTLLRIFLASEQVVAYGSTQISTEITAYVVEIFLSCIVVAVKLAMPILAAELMGEIGMGILMQEKFLLKVKDMRFQGVGFTCGGFIHQTAKNEIDYYPAWADRLNLRFIYRMYKEPHTRKRYLQAALLFPARFIFERIFG